MWVIEPPLERPFESNSSTTLKDTHLSLPYFHVMYNLARETDDAIRDGGFEQGSLVLEASWLRRHRHNTEGPHGRHERGSARPRAAEFPGRGAGLSGLTGRGWWLGLGAPQEQLAEFPYSDLLSDLSSHCRCLSQGLLMCGLESAFTVPCSIAHVEGALHCSSLVGDPHARAFPFLIRAAVRHSHCTGSSPPDPGPTSTLTPIPVPTKTLQFKFTSPEPKRRLLAAPHPIPLHPCPLPLPPCLILSVISQSTALALICPLLFQAHPAAFHTTR